MEGRSMGGGYLRGLAYVTLACVVLLTSCQASVAAPAAPTVERAR